MNKKIVLSLLLITSLCACGTSAIIAGFFIVTPASTSSGVGAVEPAPDLPANAESASVDPARESLPADLAAQMDTIQQQVTNIRGLRANKPVSRALLTTSELKDKVETDFFEDYSTEDAREDEILLTTLGLIPDGFELLDFFHRLYAEQIAGYYDSDTKDMYVVKGEGFGGIERMTYAHEYTHTLQDQNYDIREGLKLDDDYCEYDAERCSAVTALLEGDATFTEEVWITTNATGQDKQDMSDFYKSYSSPVFDSAPEYMQADFLFPYQKGLEFVYSLNDRGGYQLVDQAFANPPVTTELILHPDKYPAEKQITITLPALNGVLTGDWKELSRNELGEWYTYLILAKGNDPDSRLMDSFARAASAGWGGDKYAIFSNTQNGQVVFVLHSRWDSRSDADEFLQALQQYGKKRWGEPSRIEGNTHVWNNVREGGVMVSQSGADTLWLIAPDTTMLDALYTQFPEFKH